MKDLTFAARSLLRSPGFTVVAVVTLALGIGANTAIFTVIQSTLLDPLPYEQPEELVRYWSTWEQFPRGSISEPEFLDYASENQVFERIAIYRGRDKNLVVPDGDPRRVSVEEVTGEFFPLLGVTPLLGRTIEGSDDGPGAPAIAVVSYGFWQSSFGGEQDVLGSIVDLEGELTTIVGVMEKSFVYPDAATELWVPARIDPAAPAHRGAHNHRGIARLKDDITLARAQSEMSAIASRMQEHYPESYPDGSGFGVALVALFEHTVGASRQALIVLFGAVGVVLLIACANVANLTLVRAIGREKELTLRSVLGAGRPRLVTALVAESVIIGSLGLGAGLAIAYGGLASLKALGPDAVPRLAQASIDGRVIAFTAAVSMLTVALFGVLPALRASGASLLVGDGVRASGGRGQSRTRSMLVIAQVSLAVLLLVGAGLLLRSFRELVRVEPGFQPNNLLALELGLGVDRYPERAQRSRFFAEAAHALQIVPGVVAAGSINNPPLSGWNSDNYLDIEGHTPVNGYVTEEMRAIAGSYFRAMGIPLLRGDTFSGNETEDGARVFVISESFAEKFWPGEDPIGKRARMGDERPWMRVIGVVGDVHHNGLGEAVKPTYYLPHTYEPWRTMTLVVRADDRPESIAPSAQHALARLDATQPVYAIRTYETLMSESVTTPRFHLALLLLFGATAVTLAAVGIYGVLAHVVGQRTREIGVRMALGASSWQVPWLVVKQGVSLVAVGLGLGLVAALGVGRLLESMLFGVGARDPWTFAGVAASLTVVAFVACYAPARRAARVHPVVALRHD